MNTNELKFHLRISGCSEFSSSQTCFTVHLQPALDGLICADIVHAGEAAQENKFESFAIIECFFKLTPN